MWLPVGDALAEVVERVRDKMDSCSGCGACEWVSERIEVVLDDAGNLRPRVGSPAAGEASATREAREFAAICPGLSLTRQVTVAPVQHAVFGPYFSAWEGHATDPEMRFTGSSAGVLTALSAWLIETGRTRGIVASGPAEPDPTRTVPVRIQTRDEALRAAGSRYAPVANAARAGFDPQLAFVGKPCEVSAVRALRSTVAGCGGDAPVLSFFCAGTPAQTATDELVKRMGAKPGDVRSLRYRGTGAPGRFSFEDSHGVHEMDYSEAWGTHLGRALPWRCKLCPDGTGQDADIAVGDFWSEIADGYPDFSESEGTSVVLARTPLGQQLLLAACDDGVIALSSINLADLQRTQPLQAERRATLVWRLLGRRLAGRRVPRFRRWGLWRVAVWRPRQVVRGIAGTALRTRGFR